MLEGIRSKVLVVVIGALAGACAEAPDNSACDQYADKQRESLLADEKLGLDQPKGKALLDYAVDAARDGCMNEMTKAEVECVLAGKSSCYDEHRPWYRKLRYEIEDLAS